MLLLLLLLLLLMIDEVLSLLRAPSEAWEMETEACVVVKGIADDEDDDDDRCC